ncbi:Vi polysaccharide biosynthesis UDP-N-acetylglucosamine C-6 dehydrogenase TviB [Sphingorhabdus sp.]|uniref:Vi polysaccharide biosynthesis UDP-N-acetylglucosamine C-6 dehydrogenase TviB n=1 Tax=Sphingorhabdus sp. TaxID=1902408 RepID=UPI0035B3977A
MKSNLGLPLPDIDSAQIAIIGLGYVGLPLAVEFGKQRSVIGFDTNSARIMELQNGHDSTLEVSNFELAAASNLILTSNPEDLKTADVYIITVPTPIDRFKRPDLSSLIKASETVGKVLKRGDVVVYESTVYPGCTEEDCAPILEQFSGLTLNEDFACGYSPERINPGDKEHRLATIRKVTSGSTSAAAIWIDKLYSQIITAGTFMATSIKVAEAAKVIENTQRDLNIALMNELSIIFARLGIDTHSVLEAASTKWNFLKFTPGLVGGHCIGVDPYYLTHKAQAIGFHPEVILAGRRVNDGMGAYVSTQIVRLMIKRSRPVQGARILILGLAFKENCPDIRNTRVIDLFNELTQYGAEVDIYDPLVDISDAKRQYNINLIEDPAHHYDTIILAVAHKEFLEMGSQKIRTYGNDGSLLIDVKSAFPLGEADMRL